MVQVVKAEGIKISQPLHAFRHSFKTLQRTLKVSDSVSNSITGHSSGNAGDEYGTVYLETIQKVINQIPRLGLQRFLANLLSFHIHVVLDISQV